ncbi:hypothetical protein B0H19DRAFT_961720, partial [Mycena capillaripes]
VFLHGTQLTVQLLLLFCYRFTNTILVLVYGVNGKNMEKFYWLGSFVVLGACTIPLWAASEYGWYASNGLCWLRDPTSTIQLHWLLGTQSIPMLIMSATEVVSFVTILVFMLKYEARFLNLS